MKTAEALRRINAMGFHMQGCTNHYILYNNNGKHLYIPLAGKTVDKAVHEAYNLLTNKKSRRPQ